MSFIKKCVSCSFTSFPLSLIPFFPSYSIANHVSNWWLSCQIQCMNTLAQFLLCSLLSVFASKWVFLIGTSIRILFIVELYVSGMWLVVFFSFYLSAYIKKNRKKEDFLSRYLIDFKVNYMKENLSSRFLKVLCSELPLLKQY